MTTQTLAGWRYVPIEYGDTLQAIAARELNDASQWPKLIAINNLQFPYITADYTQAGPGVKFYGQFLAVPSVDPQPLKSIDPDASLQTDLDLTDGRLSAVNGDYATVSGRFNLAQAIRNRIATTKRELIRHLNYGTWLSRIKGAANGPTSLLLSAEYVKGALLDDPRISSVTNATATSAGDTITVNVTVQPISGSPVSTSAGG